MKPAGQHESARTISSLLFVVLLAAATAATPGNTPSPSRPNAQSPPNPQNPISVTSELVAIPVSVTDADGNFVPSLMRDNFRIYENNRLQEIALFEQEDTPVGVGLLVDHSSSMETKLPNVLAAISGFTHSSNPQDEMFVVNFSDSVTIERPVGKAFTSDPKEVQQMVSAAAASGQTALYDAVIAGLNHLRASHWQKKALVLISDGGDNVSFHKYSQVLDNARQSQVAIYCIGLVDEFGEEENPRMIEQLSKDTGGIAFFPHTAPAVMASTAQIARDLREQYMLGFVPEKGSTDSFHKIQVRVSAPQHGKLHIRARPGYAVGESQESPGSLKEKMP